MVAKQQQHHPHYAQQQPVHAAAAHVHDRHHFDKMKIEQITDKAHTIPANAAMLHSEGANGNGYRPRHYEPYPVASTSSYRLADPPAEEAFWPGRSMSANSTHTHAAAAAAASSSRFARIPPARRHEDVIGLDLLDQARAMLGSEEHARNVVHQAFFWRASSSTFGCVHLPSILDIVSSIFEGDWHAQPHQPHPQRRRYPPHHRNQSLDLDYRQQAQVEETIRVPPIKVALVMMVVAEGLRLLPRKMIQMTFHKVNENHHLLRHVYGPVPDHARQLAHLARTQLLNEIQSGARSLTHIQVVCLLLHFDTDGGHTNELLFDHALRIMRRWPLDRFSPTVRIGDIGEELAVRCWWFLVCRDWLGAAASGSYTIQPAHFACRLPAEISDEQLAGLEVKSVPRNASELTDEELQMIGYTNLSGYLPVRFSLVVIQFAHLVRRLVDLRTAKTMDQVAYGNEVVRELELFCVSLPDIYGLQRTRNMPDGSLVASVNQRTAAQDKSGDFQYITWAAEAKYGTERWLIHQYIFYSLLELHSPMTISAPARISVPLAEHILDIFQDIENICSVTDYYKFKCTNAINACIVLLLHMIELRREGSLTFIRRDLLFRKTRRVINHSKDELISNNAEAFNLVMELLKMENQGWTDQSVASNGAPQNHANNGFGPSVSAQTFIPSTFLAATNFSTDTFYQAMATPPSAMSSGTSTATALTPLESSVVYAQRCDAEAAKGLDDRKDPDWLASLPSDLGNSTLFLPHADDPNNIRFYDSIRSTLTFSDGVDAI